jgi:hypothetical protein
MDPVTSFNISNIFNSAYLFNTNPGESTYKGPTFLVSILLLLLTTIAYRALRKKRDRIKLNRDQRLGLLKAVKVNMILSGLLMLFICSRWLSIPVLSMRVFPLVSLLLMFGAALFGVYQILRYRNSESLAGATPDEYAKYLPRKKKK